MGTEVRDPVQPLSLNPGPYEQLIERLQLLLTKVPVLTLLMLVGEAPTDAGTDAPSRVKAGMDDVEQLLLACFRRSDRIVRCGEGSCAAILLGAEVDGALYAVNRFQRMLGSCAPLSISLRVGVAAAPEQAADSRALLTLVLKPSLHMLLVTGAEKGVLPRMDALPENDPSVILPLPKGSAAQRKARKTKAHFEQALVVPSVSERSSESRLVLRGGEPVKCTDALTRARARTLGIPYIAPPQRIPSSVRNLLSVEVMHQLQCLPIGRDRHALTVALADPTDRSILYRLEQITGMRIFPVMTDPDALEALAQPARSRRISQVASASARPSGH